MINERARDGDSGRCHLSGLFYSPGSPRRLMFDGMDGWCGCGGLAQRARLSVLRSSSVQKIFRTGRVLVPLKGIKKCDGFLANDATIG